MTNEAWAQGWSILRTLPVSGDVSVEEWKLRGRIYREELDHLPDERFYNVVRQAIRQERWFPTVAQLLTFNTALEEKAQRERLKLEEEKRDADRRATRRRMLSDGDTQPRVGSMTQVGTILHDARWIEEEARRYMNPEREEPKP